MIAHHKTHRCQVFDANGLQWHHMRWLDTETGEGEQAVVDADGAKQLNAERTELLVQHVKLAALVLLKFKDNFGRGRIA